MLSLRWNTHQSTFINTLSTIRNKELFSDVTVTCEGKFFALHKFVLSACSEYFSEMFERSQCKHPIIVLQDTSSIDWEYLLSYMYDGHANVLEDRLPSLMRTARSLKIKGLIISERSTDEIVGELVDELSAWRNTPEPAEQKPQIALTTSGTEDHPQVSDAVPHAMEDKLDQSESPKTSEPVRSSERSTRLTAKEQTVKQEQQPEWPQEQRGSRGGALHEAASLLPLCALSGLAGLGSLSSAALLPQSTYSLMNGDGDYLPEDEDYVPTVQAKRKYKKRKVRRQDLDTVKMRGVPMKASKKYKDLTCKTCGKVLRSRESLRYHTMRHTGERPHKCEHCGKGFITVGARKQHVSVHHASKSHAPKPSPAKSAEKALDASETNGVED